MAYFQVFGDRPALYQWDTGRRVIVDCDCQEVHFSNALDGEALVVETYTDDGTKYANIPNILLQAALPLNVYAYVCSSERYTQRAVVLEVNPRSKPADYVYTETEVKNYDALAARIAKLEESGGVDPESFAKTPVVINGTYNGSSIRIDSMTYIQLEEITTDRDVVIIASSADDSALVVAKCVPDAGAFGTLYLIQDGENIQSVGCIIGFNDNEEGGVVGYLTVTHTYIPGETISEIAKQAAAGVVKSVNGVTPDESGNVKVETGTPTDEQIRTAVNAYLTENPVSGGGMSATAINLLIDILESAVYGTNVSGKIASLKEALLAGGSGGGDTGGGDMPDNPVEPDEPVVPDDITVSNGVMTIISVGSEIAVSGGVMTIA